MNSGFVILELVYNAPISKYEYSAWTSFPVCCPVLYGSQYPASSRGPLTGNRGRGRPKHRPEARCGSFFYLTEQNALSRGWS